MVTTIKVRILKSDVLRGIFFGNVWSMDFMRKKTVRFKDFQEMKTK
jgi:hypothetical protein